MRVTVTWRRWPSSSRSLSRLLTSFVVGRQQHLPLDILDAGPYACTKWEKDTKYTARRYLPAPNELLSCACFACLLSHVFRPCMVLHKTTQHDSTCFFQGITHWHRFGRWEKCALFSIWITSTVKNKSNPCEDRIARFLAGLHCQAQKGRPTAWWGAFSILQIEATRNLLVGSWYYWILWNKGNKVEWLWQPSVSEVHHSFFHFPSDPHGEVEWGRNRESSMTNPQLVEVVRWRRSCSR